MGAPNKTNLLFHITHENRRFSSFLESVGRQHGCLRCNGHPGHTKRRTTSYSVGIGCWFLNEVGVEVTMRIVWGSRIWVTIPHATPFPIMNQTRQTTLTMWRRPRGPKPGGDGAGPPASKGPASTTGGSANLEPRGRQSKATGQHHLPTTTLVVTQWNAKGVRHKKPELQAFFRNNKSRKRKEDILSL